MTAALEGASLDLATLRAAYAAGARPADVVAEVYRRLAALDDPGVFLHLRDEADVLAEADALPPSGAGGSPLWGAPFAVKDNMDVAGTPTTAGCPAFAYEPAEDAFAVAALRQAGALLIGKTNLDQFATGLTGLRAARPPKNALDPEIAPGGSSSGSAVAVARGLVSFALGTDTAGSGRAPAALNNIVGLKPSLGAISTRGVVPACRTLDAVSIMALTVDDAWRVFEAAARYDAEDPFARRIDAPSLSEPPPACVVGVPSPETRVFFGDDAQAESFEATLTALAAEGAEIRQLDFSIFYEIGRLLYEGPWVAERLTVVAPLLEAEPEAILPVTRRIIGQAAALSAADAFRGFYRLAELRRAAEPILAEVDLLCVPTLPTFYSVADAAADPTGPNARLGLYTSFVNLMDLCGVATPTGFRADGRPGSATLLARAGRDAAAAAMAERLHHRLAPKLGAADAPTPPAPHRVPMWTA